MTNAAVRVLTGIVFGVLVTGGTSPFSGKSALAIATSDHRVQIDRSITSAAGTYVRIKGTERGGFVVPNLATSGRLKNGTWVYLVPLDSGGSASVMNVLVFAWIGRASRLVGAVESDGGHVGSRVTHGTIEIRMPIYGANDPNCCPSRLRTLHYTVAKGRLVVLDDHTSALPRR